MLQCFGTPEYMAPEIKAMIKEEELKIYGNYVKSDVYSTALYNQYLHSKYKSKQRGQE